MKTFELKNWMTENRELVINVYNETSKNEFFIGISLKDFMLKVYNMMNINNPKSEKRAASLLPTILGYVAYNVSRPYTF
jgi:hypothetical protein